MSGENDDINITPDAEDTAYNWNTIPNKPDAFRGAINAEEGSGETTQGDTSTPQAGSEPDLTIDTSSNSITKDTSLSAGANTFKEFMKYFENDKGNLNLAGQIGLSMLKGLGAGMTADKQAQFKAEEAQKDRDFKERMIKEERDARRIKVTAPTIKLQGTGMINEPPNPYRPTGTKVTT